MAELRLTLHFRHANPIGRVVASVEQPEVKPFTGGVTYCVASPRVSSWARGWRGNRSLKSLKYINPLNIAFCNKHALKQTMSFSYFFQ